MATTINIGGKKVKVDDSFNDLDAAGQEKVIRRIERDLGVSSRNPAKREEKGTTLKDVGRFALGQGLALGFGDEIEAGVKSAFTDETYDQAVNRIRGEMDDYRKDNAGKALLMELGGGLLTGGVGAGRAAAGAAARGAMGAIKSGALTGAGVGGIAGFGSGRDTLENRLTSAAIGAGAGGVLGGALPAAGGAIKSGVNRLRGATDTLSESGVNRAADLKILQKLEAEGLSPSQALARLKQAQRDGVSDTMIADVGGESVRGLASGATTVSGKARTLAEEALDTRQAKSGFEIADDVMNTIGSGKTAGDALEEISNNQMRTARPAFDMAFRNEGVDRMVNAGKLTNLSQIPAFKDAIKQGLSIANVRKLNDEVSDEAVTALRALNDAVKKGDKDLAGLNIPAEAMHFVKMGFDDVIGMGKTGQNLSSAGRTMQGGLKQAQRQFIDIIDEATGKNYKPALDQFAGNMRLQEAIETGGQLFRMTPDKLRAAVKGMSASEKEAFRIGVADAIRNRVSNQRDLANSAQDLFGKDRFRTALRDAFPDAKSFSEFEKRMTARINQEVTRSRTKPSGGSRTTPLAEDARDITRDAELFTNLLSGNIGAVGRDVITRGGGLGAKIGTNVARDLFDTNLGNQREILRRLSQLRRGEKQRLRQSAQRAARSGGRVGAVSGLLTD
jgi:hypothetical protein